MDVRVEVFYSGHVQGVGFRYRVCQIAERLLVRGWVRNLPDGRVQLAAEGQKPELQTLLDEVGATLIDHIQDQQVVWLAHQGEPNGFRVA